jgi:hypothetical protein
MLLVGLESRDHGKNRVPTLDKFLSENIRGSSKESLMKEKCYLHKREKLDSDLRMKVKVQEIGEPWRTV